MQDGVQHDGAGWGVARASSNFFALLGLPVRFRGDGDEAWTRICRGVILSESLWKREFGADPHVAGSVVRVGLRRATIAGVAPEGPWDLPGKVDAWLLEPDSQMTRAGAGYVVAHCRLQGNRGWSAAIIPIKSYAPHRTPDDLLGVSIGNGMPGPWDVFRFASLLAFLALPAVSSVSFGED